MISRVVIEGFRGMPQRRSFEMAPITLLSGRNGFGKTTVFDAIDWCLFGSAWRLGDDSRNVRNLYYPEIEPFVAVTLALNGHPVAVERRESGVTFGGVSVSERDLALEFLRDQDSVPPYARDLGARLRRMAYLPQTDMRKLVEAGSQAERQALIQSLLGVLNAVVVESSTRRIKGRIEERRQGLEARLREIQQDRATVSRQDGDSPNRSDIASLGLDSIRSLLGSSAEGISSLETLSELGDRALRRLRERKIELVEFRKLVESESKAVEEYLRERNARETEIVQGRSRLEQLRQEVSTVSATVERLTKERAEVELRLETAKQTADRIRRALNANSTIARISQVLQQSQESHEGAQRRLEAVRQRAVGAKNAADAARSDLERLRPQLTELTGREETARRAANTTIELQSLRSALRQTEERVGAAGRTEQTLKGSVESARRRLTDVAARYEQARARASRWQRVISILAEVPELLADRSITACPLCGQEYRDSASLLMHIREASSRREAESQELASLRSIFEAEQRTVLENEAKLTEAGKSHLEAREALAFVHRHMDALLERRSQLLEAPDAAEAGRERAAMEDTVRAAEGKVRLLELEWRAAEDEVAPAETDAVRLANETEIVRARLVNLTNAMSLEDRTRSPQELGSDVRAAEEQAQESSEVMRRIQTSYEAALVKRQNGERDVAAAEQRIRDAEALLAGLNERIRGAEARIREKTVAVLGPEVNNPVQRSRSESEEADTTELKLQRALNELARLRADRDAEERRSRIGSLSAAEQDIRVELGELERASRRFGEVAESVNARARDEGNTAGQRIRAGIQECLRELYPHRHLDEVDLDIVAGDVLLTDRFLSHSVQPEPYSSTGQLNVLALALFIATALRQQMSKLSFLLLDEPIQNLDDVHFLAFIALVKRIVLSRQIIVSTADKNVSEIFRRQMLEATDGAASSRYRQYEWRGFDPKKGPDVTIVGTAAHSPSRSKGRGSSRPAI